MSQIAYDPVKDRFAAYIKHSRFLRRCFYFLLDMFFLRGWHVRRALRRELKTRNQAHILDAGCGFGQYDRFMLSRFPSIRIHAVDIKQDYLNDCRYFFSSDISSGRIRFDETDLTRDSYPTIYDAVVCVDVLEHIENDVHVMKTLQQALKPGGFFIMHSPSHLAEEDAAGDPSFVGEHARAGYSRDELHQKLTDAGFTSTRINYTYGKSGHLAWELLIKWPMLWLSTSFAFVVVLPFWYVLTLIPGLLLMRADLITGNTQGTGIMALAYK